VKIKAKEEKNLERGFNEASTGIKWVICEGGKAKKEGNGAEISNTR
jgi:hypothetical protein